MPRVGNESTSIWAQYTIRLAPGQRDGLAAALKAQGIPTAIYYRKPLHRQEAYAAIPLRMAALPSASGWPTKSISLPMHAYLEPPVQDRIVAAVRQHLAN